MSWTIYRIRHFRFSLAEIPSRSTVRPNGRLEMGFNENIWLPKVGPLQKWVYVWGRDLVKINLLSSDNFFDYFSWTLCNIKHFTAIYIGYIYIDSVYIIPTWECIDVRIWYQRLLWTDIMNNMENYSRNFRLCERGINESIHFMCKNTAIYTYERSLLAFSMIYSDISKMVTSIFTGM